MRHYQVRDVMTAGPVTVTPSTPIKEVASMLVRLQAGALPVVTPRDGAVGIVTETDLLSRHQSCCLSTTPGGRGRTNPTRLRRRGPGRPFRRGR